MKSGGEGWGVIKVYVDRPGEQPLFTDRSVDKIYVQNEGTASGKTTTSEPDELVDIRELAEGRRV